MVKGGLETDLSVEGIKPPPRKPSSLGSPPGGFLWAAKMARWGQGRGLQDWIWRLWTWLIWWVPGLVQAGWDHKPPPVWSHPSVIHKVNTVTSDVVCCIFPPSNAPLTHFPLIPRCDFNWLEGGAGRREGCVCVFWEGAVGAGKGG